MLEFHFSSAMRIKTSVIGIILFLAMMGLSCPSDAYVYVVGNKHGWTPNPSEDYNQWAGRHRFQINDSLLFKYQKGADSVLVVTNEGYASCDTNNPIATLGDGNSLFTFDRSGPFFFISGNPENCKNGQKLITIVLSLIEKATPPPPPTLPSSPSPASSPVSPPVVLPPPPSPGVPSTASSPADPGTSPSPLGTNQGGSPAPAPSRSFSPKECSISGVAVFGFTLLVTYLVGSA